MHLFSDAMIANATQLSNGAKMPRTNWSDIAGYKVALPVAEQVAADFDDAIHPLIEKMHASIEQALALTTLRDTMLPRLISGQLRLPEVEKLVA
jgi:type I restriction enzyme S subunit